jgi:hypothetical protein
MTRVCVRCGYLVFDGERCARDRGPAIGWKVAAKACGVRTLLELLHLEPPVRLLGFASARDQLLAELELRRGPAAADREQTK